MWSWTKHCFSDEPSVANGPAAKGLLLIISGSHQKEQQNTIEQRQQSHQEPEYGNFNLDTKTNNN